MTTPKEIESQKMRTELIARQIGRAKLTDAQVKVLYALNTITKGATHRKIPTADVAFYAKMNTLAASAALRALANKKIVNRSDTANGSTSGGAYKDAWSITFTARRFIEVMNTTNN